MTGLRRQLIRLAVLALFLGIWEAAFRLGLMSSIIFASPSLIVEAATKDGWTFMLAFRITIFEITMAILIAWTLGIGFGVVAGSVPVLARIAAPVLSALIAVPLVVLYPVLIAWLGLGPASKVVFGVVSGIFPIALNTTVGVREINRGYEPWLPPWAPTGARSCFRSWPRWRSRPSYRGCDSAPLSS